MPKFTVQVSQLMRGHSPMPAEFAVYGAVVVGGLDVVDATPEDLANWKFEANRVRSIEYVAWMARFDHSETENYDPAAVDKLIGVLRGMVRPSAQPGHLSE